MSSNILTTMKLKPLSKLQNHNECLGICFDSSKDNIFFGANGKELSRYNLRTEETELITTISEVSRTWNDDYGNTFLQDFIQAPDGYIYAAAKNRILSIDPKSGNYETIIFDGFSGPWGAYGITTDGNSNLLVGDHAGGIHFFHKDDNWRKETLISPESVPFDNPSFGGVRLTEDGDSLFYLDFENSSLLHCFLEWKNGYPKAGELLSLPLNMNFPEFLQIFQGDVYVKSARENFMVKVSQGSISQSYDFESTIDVSPIVTFLLNNDSGTTHFFGVDWGPNGALFKGVMP